MPRREICHILCVSNRPVIPLTLKIVFGLAFILNKSWCDIHFRGGSFVDWNIVNNFTGFHDGYNPTKCTVHPHKRIDEWTEKGAFGGWDGWAAVRIKCREFVSEFFKSLDHLLNIGKN